MFTRIQDFERLITDNNLTAILRDQPDILEDVENYAKEKIQGYLLHRYDLTHIFKDLQKFSITQTYYPNDIIYYTESEFDLARNYTTGERFSYEGDIYEVIQNCVGITPPDTAYYTQICEDNLLYITKLTTNGNYPDNSFSFNTTENSLTDFDRIIGWDKRQPLTITRNGQYLEFYISGELKARADYITDIDYPYTLALNPVTDGVASGLTGFVSLIDEVTNVTVTLVNYFEQKDGRNQVVLDWTLKIMLYEIHSRINPRYIPELRVKQYDDVMKELEKAGKGLININLPLQVKEDDRSIPFIWGQSNSKGYKF